LRTFPDRNGEVDMTQPALPPNPRRRVLIAGAEALFFLGLALYSVWPLPTEFRTSLPQATESVATVPLFNLWTIWWNADRLAHRCSGYWDAPIFYPTPATFAFSEPQPVSMAVAPLVWLNDTPVAAYNSYLILSLVLNGCAGAWLVRQIGGSRWAGLAGGAMLLMLPFVHWQLGVLQLVPVWGVLWTIGALREFGLQPGVRRSVMAGAALGLTYLSCAYHGLFLILLLVGAGPWLFGRNLWNWRTPVKLMPGAVVCLLLVAPVLTKQREIIRKFEFERTAEIITTLSAEAGDYSVTPWPQLLPGGDFADPERRPYWQLGPGNVKWLLAAVGVIIGLVNRRLRLWTAFAISFTALAVLLSLGLKFKIGAWIPYQLLIDWFPGMAQVRNVFRFALFAQIMTAVLAAQGLEAVTPVRWKSVLAWWRGRGKQRDSGVEKPAEPASEPSVGRAWAVTGAILTLLAGGMAALEVRPPRQVLFHLPPLEDNTGWISWLKQNTPPEAVVACLPFPTGVTVDDYQETTLWMTWGSCHRRRMVNGYSGFFPPPYMTLKPKMDYFPDPASLDELATMGVGYCVIRYSSVDPAAWGRMFTQFSSRLKPRHWDERAGVGIFELVNDVPESSD
jgi:hypothetical protein